MRKLCYEEVEQKFKECGFELIDKKYKNNQTKMAFKNEEGYIGVMSLGNLMSGKKTQYVSKFNPYSIDNIKLYLLNNNSDTKLLSNKYVSCDKPLLFQCGCGEIFERSWDNMRDQIYLECPKCALKSRGKTRRVDFSIVKDEFEKAGYKLLCKEEDYHGNSTRLLCADKNGYLGYKSYNKVRQRGNTPITKFSTKSNSKENVIHNINLWAKLNNIDAVCLDFCDDNKWSTQGIICKCSCGNIFETSIASFTSGTKHTCGDCANSVSRLERLTEDWLNENNIKYIKQYRFEDCRNILPLPFDFYIPTQNTLIEVDGEGHYQVAYFHNCSYDKAFDSYKRTAQTDKIKDEYCQQNGIFLLRIPFWEYDDDTYKQTLYTNLIKD